MYEAVTRKRFALLCLLMLSLGGLGAAGTPGARIPAGNYLPLYGVGKGVKRVEIKSFYLDERPVTNREYLAFVRKNPQWRRSKVKSVFADKGYLRHWRSDLEPGPGASERPVVNVSWFAARAYAEWAGKRLPTQDEWEYVARSDERRADASRDPAFQRKILEWYGRPTPNPLPEVGASEANLYGVYDMHGLVWEWVEDFNTVFVTGESRQDSGLDRGLFCAAGAASSTDPSDYAAYMRYAFRSSLSGRYTVANLGFRCARNIQEVKR